MKITVSTRSVFLRRLAALASAALAAAVLTACTSSGDGGVGATDDFLEAGAHVPESENPGTIPWVGLTQSVDTREVFCVDVNVHRVSDLYSVTFTLAHDSSQASFRGHTLGSFLGMDLLVTVDGSSPGEVVVGMTREMSTHGSTGVSTSGGDPERLIQLCYDVVGEGTERGFDFIPNLRLEGPPPAGADLNATFVGSTLTTRLP